MRARGFWTLGDVSDGDLQGQLKELLRAGSHTEARIVAHLAEVECAAVASWWGAFAVSVLHR